MSRRFFRVLAILAAFLASTVAMPFLLRTPPGSQSWAIAIAQAYALPTTALIISLLFRQLATHDPSQTKQSRCGSSDALILNAGIAFVVGLHLILLATLLGGAEWAARAPSLLVGVFLILVGNVLPRLRRNLLLGVRTPWSLSDERAWTRTHWASGYALFTFGLIVLAVALLAPRWVGRVVSLGAFLLAAALVLASYWYRSSMPRSAETPKPEEANPGPGPTPGADKGEEPGAR